MNVSRDDNGEIVLESEDHSISFSFNRRQITPESEDERKKFEMISDVMNTPRGSGSSRTQQLSLNDME